MNTSREVTRACFKAQSYLKRSAPTIMTCVAAVGMVATVVMAVKATPKAIRLLEQASEEKGEKLSGAETVKTAAPVYIPACTTGLFTLSLIFAGE